MNQATTGQPGPANQPQNPNSEQQPREGQVPDENVVDQPLNREQKNGEEPNRTDGQDREADQEGWDRNPKEIWKEEDQEQNPDTDRSQEGDPEIGGIDPQERRQ